MTTAVEGTVATQTYRLYIDASPETIWDSITDPDDTDSYGYRGRVEYDLRPGGGFRVHAGEAMRAQGSPDVIIDGEVIEAEAPRRLVQTWKPHFDEESKPRRRRG